MIAASFWMWSQGSRLRIGLNKSYKWFETTNFSGGRPGGMGGTTNGITKIITYAKWAGVAILVLIFGIIGYIWYKKRKSRKRR